MARTDKYTIQQGTLNDIGDAIREKRGYDSSHTITPGNMPNEILGIESGGGGLTVDVIYDENVETYDDLYPNGSYQLDYVFTETLFNNNNHYQTPPWLNVDWFTSTVLTDSRLTLDGAEPINGVLLVYNSSIPNNSIDMQYTNNPNSNICSLRVEACTGIESDDIQSGTWYTREIHINPQDGSITSVSVFEGNGSLSASTHTGSDYVNSAIGGSANIPSPEYVVVLSCDEIRACDFYQYTYDNIVRSPMDQACVAKVGWLPFLNYIGSGSLDNKPLYSWTTRFMKYENVVGGQAVADYDEPTYLGVKYFSAPWQGAEALEEIASSFCVGYDEFGNWNNWVIDMSYMFDGCKSLKRIDLCHLFMCDNPDLCSWYGSFPVVPIIDTSYEQLLGFARTFRNCHNLRYVRFCGYATYNGSTSEVGFTPDLSFFYDSSYTSFYETFKNCYSLIEVNFGGSVQQGYVRNFEGCFSNCHSLKKLTEFSDYLSGSIIQNISHMFENCYSLEEIPDDIFKKAQEGQLTISLYDASYAFYNCHNLKGDVFCYLYDNGDSWDSAIYHQPTLSHALDHMFDGCYSMESVTFPNLSVNESDETYTYSTDPDYGLKSFSYLFANCYSLKRIVLFDDDTWVDFRNLFEDYHIRDISYMCYHCYSLEGFWFPDNHYPSDMYFGPEDVGDSDWSVINWAHAFDGCYSVKELDLSHVKMTGGESFDANYKDAFKDMLSLERLTMPPYTPTYHMVASGQSSSRTRLEITDAPRLWCLNAYPARYSYAVTGCDSLIYYSINNILENLQTVQTTQTIEFDMSVLYRLSSTDIASATQKGWRIAALALDNAYRYL